MNELNRKLAERAGFKWGITERTHNHMEQDVYVYPDCSIHLELPDFPSSLDACFKWLVPKALKDYQCQAQVGNTANGESFGYLWHFKPPFCFYEHKEPESGREALALCKAIEQLIDKELKNGE